MSTLSFKRQHAENDIVIDTLTPPPIKSNSNVPDILYFDMDAAVKTQKLSYSEQLIAFVAEGLANSADATAPVVLFNAAYMNFDWPGSDQHWRQWLTSQKRANFVNITESSLCGLLTTPRIGKQIKGIVLYDSNLTAQQVNIISSFRQKHTTLTYINIREYIYVCIFFILTVPHNCLALLCVHHISRFIVIHSYCDLYDS